MLALSITRRPWPWVLPAALWTTLACAPAQRELPWHDDADHPANRVFHAAYVVEVVPRFVGAALPGEHGDDADFFVSRWYFRQRPGNEGDQAIHGGDRRQLPRERFAARTSIQVQEALRALDGAVLTELRSRPRTAIYLQHDLLRLARRLVDTKANPELLAPLLAAAERLALPADTLLRPDLRTFDRAALAPALHGVDAARFLELDRKSTRLFDASRTQLWSRVWLATPATTDPTAAKLVAQAADPDREAPLEVPIGTQAILAQGIVALDDTGQPRATGLVIDVRTQRLSNRDPLGRGNPTTTRDGVDLRQWFLSRETVARAEAATEPKGITFDDFDEIPMTAAALFRDYGTLKHTTYFAQCALCHRQTDTPGAELGGFLVLRQNAKPRPAGPSARERLAEGQLAEFVGALRSR